MVHLSSTAIRRAAFVVAILGVAAAATAMWNRYAPPNACLFCAAPEHYEAALNPTSTAVGTSGAAVGGAYRPGQYASASSTAIPGSSVAAAPSGGGSATTHGDVRRTWTPWSVGGDAHRFGASGTNAPSVGMGGLWRLMNVVHRGEPAAAAPVAHAEPAPREARPAATPAAPKPPRSTAPAHPPSAAPPPSPLPDPVPAPLPPLPAPGPTATPSGGPVAPANPFTGHETPPSDPFVPPPPQGPLDPGGPGGTGTSGSGPAATPEPASLLLIATGLAAVFVELRRRRAI